MDEDWVRFFRDTLVLHEGRVYRMKEHGANLDYWWDQLKDKDHYNVRGYNRSDLPGFDIFVSNARMWEKLSRCIEIRIPNTLRDDHRIYADFSLPDSLIFDFDYAIIETSDTVWYACVPETNLIHVQKVLALHLLTA